MSGEKGEVPEITPAMVAAAAQEFERLLVLAPAFMRPRDSALMLQAAMASRASIPE